MSFFKDVMPLILSLVAVAAILYCFYLLSRFLSKKAGTASGTGNIRILERAMLSQDKGLLIAEICKSVYLIGFADNGIQILKDLDRDTLKEPQPAQKKRFLDVLQSALDTGLDFKKNGRKNEKNEKNGE